MMTWPKVFETGKIESCWEHLPDIYKDGKLDERRAKMRVCANGLEAWGIVFAGKDLSGELPKNFGQVMIILSDFLGIFATPDSFSKYADDNIGRGKK